MDPAQQYHLEHHPDYQEPSLEAREVDYNYVVDTFWGHALSLRIENDVVTHADPRFSISKRIVGLTKGAIKSICKRYFKPRGVVYRLVSIDWLRQKENERRAAYHERTTKAKVRTQEPEEAV